MTVNMTKQTMVRDKTAGKFLHLNCLEGKKSTAI